MTKKVSADVALVPKISAPFNVPLSTLVLIEDENVRSSESISKDGIEQMAAMLDSTGQLYPLLISKSADGKNIVHAGQRRTRGFWFLRDKGRIPADHPVEVREIDASKGIDLSLIENLSQEPMHPADEFAAFKRLEDKGMTNEQIAKTYGCKVLHVKRRMKLAAVHPTLLARFRKGSIHLDQITALASCDDQERQLQIWDSLPEYQRNDQQIRRRIAAEDVSVKDWRVKMVGMDAYLAAGGSVRTDLFSEKGNAEFITDPGLLDMLLAEKLEVYAEEVRGEGWAWVDVLNDFGYEQRQNYSDYPVVHLPETDDQRQRREALEKRLEELSDKCDAHYDKDETTDAEDAEIEQCEKDIESITNQIMAILAERVDRNGVDMLIAGAVVFLDDGKIVCKKAMVRAADAKKLRKQSTETAARGGDAGAQGAGTTESISERLMMNLSAQRTAAIQASMLSNQKVTLAALAALMATREFGEPWEQSPIKISMNTQWRTLQDSSPTFAGSAASAALLKERDDWKAKLPQETDAYFAWFNEQPVETSLGMITFGTAITINALRGRVESSDGASYLAAALGLDMRQWWSPTPENYLGLVPKSKMIDAVTEAKGPTAAQGMDKMKKDAAIAHAAAALEGSGWLPSPLR